jgi:hypothetical protein
MRHLAGVSGSAEPKKVLAWVGLIIPEVHVKLADLNSPESMTAVRELTGGPRIKMNRKSAQTMKCSDMVIQVLFSLLSPPFYSLRAAHSLTHSLTQSLTHSVTQSLSHSLNDT